MDRSAPSPRGALSRLRRNKGAANASSNSLGSASADADDNDSNEGGGLRASMDATIEKVKQRARRGSNANDGGDGRRGSKDDSSSRRLTSLIPRRKRSSKPDLARNLSAHSGDSGDGRSIASNQSDLSLLEGSGRSSLLTEDNSSDVEGKPPRPRLSPHQSHTGLLTLSSPELNAQANSVSTAYDPAHSDETTSYGTSTTSIPHIIEPSDPEPFPTADDLKSHASPADRFKKAFAIPRKQGGRDVDSVKSTDSGASGQAQGGGTGLGGLLNKSRSRASSVNSNAPDEVTRAAQVVPDPDVSVIELPQTETTDTADAGQPRPETPQRKGRSRINTTSLPATPPNLVETPTTFVTPPTPTDPNADASTFPTRKSVTSHPQASPPTNRPLSSIESIRHRRAQSANLPSKLSNTLPAPLTPTVEETKTPGGTLTQPTSASGFFTNFLTAAQKAADQLSNNINTISAQNKSRPGIAQSAGDQDREEVIPGAESQAGAPDTNSDKRQSAVDTLGSGDLSLSHLGITETQDVSPMSSTPDLPQQKASAQSDEKSQNVEEAAAARAVSVAYEKPVQNVVSQATGRPVSISSNDRLTLNDDHTPPRSGTDGEGIKRTGSVRSKLSGRRRRHRASSATTGTNNTIAAAIQSSATGLAYPSAHGAGHRLTGFAVASSKRNKDFHQFFRSVPEDDYLIEDYSAALQRDILLHGRLYVSEGHICFSSNILGWVTNLVIGFDEVVSIEKKNTAVIFPNAIVIATLQARNTFASLVARDSTYELLIGIWKISHPNLKSSLNGVTLDDAGTGDKTEVADPDVSDAESGDGSEDEVYDEDEEDDGGSFTEVGVLASTAGSDVGDPSLSRKTSAAPVNGAPLGDGTLTKAAEVTQAIVAVANGAPDFPGTQTHAPTECSDAAEHYDRPLTDVTIPAPLGKVYSLMWGPQSGAFMRKWLVEDQKSRELNYPDDKIGLDNDHKSMTFDYIKPLNAPVGPKQTKCITTNTLTTFDLEKAVCVNCSTQTPDVPSGSVFTTKTHYCMMWGPDNSTRLIANCTIEWTGKSWLKGPIEGGANSGQMEYVKAIVAALRAAVTSKVPAKGPIRKGKRKGKKEAADEGVQIQRETSASDQHKPTNWGVLEPLHGILGPVFGIISPFVTSQTIIAVLFVLLVYTWIVPPRMGTTVGLPGYGSPARLVAYEELWRREESNLWDWLEDRVGLDHLHTPSYSQEQQSRQRTLNARSMQKGLENERMSERQMDDAIKVTEERLAALKDAVERQKGRKKRP